MVHIVGSVDKLLIAEAAATGTPMIGKPLSECHLREQTGANVIGVWEQGRFELSDPDLIIQRNTVLVLACDQSQLARYNELFCIYAADAPPVVVLGGGRVGRSVARSLKKRRLPYRIVEMDPNAIRDPKNYLQGNAKRIEVLEKAGIRDAASVVITFQDDELNVYLTLLCRRLRSDLQIVCRATSESNVTSLHRAGADLVLSTASMGANTVFNTLRGGKVLMMAEGLHVFQVQTPETLVGKTIQQSAIRTRTGCSVIAVDEGGTRVINPSPEHSLPDKGDIVMIASVEAEEKFLQTFGRPS